MVDAARAGGSSPSYLHSLMLIGQYLNQQRARMVTLAEVDDGFLLFFFPEGRWTKGVNVALHHTELLELSGLVAGDTSNKNGFLIRGADTRDKKHPLFPMGYDVFLRALGGKLDRRAAIGLTLVETGDRVYVNYWIDKATFVIRETRRQAVSSTQIERYDAAAIARLIETSNQTLASDARRHEQALRANPHDFISSMAAALLFEGEGGYRDAETLFARIISQVPNHPEAHYHIARLAMTRHDKKAALHAIHKAVALAPSDAAVRDLHGRILRQHNKLKEAVAAFEMAVKLAPENGIHHYHLGKAYEAQGRTEEAEAEMALSSHQQAAPAWDMLQEELHVEQPAAPIRAYSSVASSALLPDLDEDSSRIPSSLPSFTNWGDASGGEAPHPSSLPQLDLPTLTTFDTTPADLPGIPQAAELAPAWPRRPETQNQEDAAPAAPAAPTSLPSRMTLEQRLAAAGKEQEALEEPVTLAPFTDAGAVPTLNSFNAPPAAPAQEVFPSQAMPPVAIAPPSRHDSAAPDASQVGPASVPSGQMGAPASVEIAAEILLIQRALDAEPGRADLHRKLGFLLARQGKTAEAAVEFRKALQASRTSL